MRRREGKRKGCNATFSAKLMVACRPIMLRTYRSDLFSYMFGAPPVPTTATYNMHTECP